MSDTPTDRRRWFQFRLRTLLGLVAVVAVLCWAFCIGLPWWHWRSLELEWESQFKQFHAGYKPSGLLQMRPETAIIFQNFGNGAGRTNDSEYFWWAYIWPNAIYILIFEVNDTPSLTPGDPLTRLEWRYCRTFKAFRIRPAPAGYTPQTNGGREAQAKWFSNCICTKGQLSYLGDYAEILLSANKDKSGFPYELIYSDPPE